MTGATPATAPACRLPPLPSSARRAREFVAGALSGLDAEVLESAQLLTSELVTNAVLHAQTPVEVRVWATDGRIHVRVRDDQPGGFARQELDIEDLTGRGLFLVESLAAAYGVDPSTDGKTVWFELWPEATSAPSEPEGWGSPPPLAGGETPIVLRNVPVGLCRSAQRHRSALLREARLAAGSQRVSLGVTPEQLAIAGRAHTAVSEGLVRAAGALDPAAANDSFEMPFPADCGELVPVLGAVLDSLNVAARQGLLLTRPALPEIHRFRRWMLDEITGQLGGAAPSSWSPLGGDQAEEGPVGEVEWRRDEFLRRTVASVAASDDNRILAVNAAAEDLLGWTAAELVGSRVTTLIPTDWRERHVAGFTNFLLTGESRLVGSSMRVPALHRDGRTVPVDLGVTVERSVQGRTVFVAEMRPAPGS